MAEYPSPEAVAAALDELLRTAEAGGDVDHLDVTLAELREAAAVFGLTVLPAEWSFRSGCEAPPATDGLAVKPVFRRDAPAGRVVRVRSFGLAGEAGVVKAGEVVVSAGPPPHGLTELEELAEAGPEGVRGELCEAFAALRPAGAGGYLELAATDLFTRFWDRAYPAWVLADPAAADTFGRALAAMLAETFGLEPFAPLHYRDHPDGWVLLPPGARMTTGRITRVLRPGLVSAGEVLRVPARAEAE